MTTVLITIIGGVFGLLTIWVQAKVHRDNRHDHAATATAVEHLASGHEKLLDGQREIKADLHDVKADLRDHSTRLRTIESDAPAKPRRKSNNT